MTVGIDVKSTNNSLDLQSLIGNTWGPEAGVPLPFPRTH